MLMLTRYYSKLQSLYLMERGLIGVEGGADLAVEMISPVRTHWSGPARDSRGTPAVFTTAIRQGTSTISLFIGPRTASNSPFSFAGTLKVSKALTKSSTSALKAAVVTFMPLCVVFISRPE